MTTLGEAMPRPYEVHGVPQVSTPYFLNQAARPVPGILRRLLAIACAVIGVEAVRRVRVGFDLEGFSGPLCSALFNMSTCETGMPGSASP